jgi:hypothetical protein
METGHLPLKKIAVVIPTYSEPWEVLRQAISSVSPPKDLEVKVILVTDGPRELPHLDPAPLVLQLPKKTADYGDTPRALGSFYAAGLGFDAICYLDADNFYDPDHLESMLDSYKETQADVIVSGRKIVRLDGTYMATCLTCDGEKFADTNCLMLTRRAFHVLQYWSLMAPEYHAIDDRVIWYAIKSMGYKTAFTKKHTVNYRASYPGYYTDLGESPPLGVRIPDNNAIDIALKKWRQSGNPSLVLKWKYNKYRRPLETNTD